MKKRIFLALIAFVFQQTYARQAFTEWQWSVIVRNSLENNGNSRAFLWIPPDCKRIRGVVVSQHNMEEISILENPIFRKNLSDLGFAEVWCAPSFDHLFRFTQGAGEAFDGMMADLAEQSGYNELRYVPVVPLGHSAAASWPYYFAAWNPERTLAAISVSGQWPYFRNPTFAPDIWGDRTIDFVPCLETMGEYESAASWSTEGLKERQQHPLMPLSMLACPAEGHFASTDKKAAYLALYIRKAVEYRYPAKEVEPFKLKPIDPSKTGWLVDKWRFNALPTAQAAPVSAFKGNPSEAFWFFDLEMAVATEAYQKAYRHYKPQLVGYVQEGKMLSQKNSHVQVNPVFKPLDDGVTFLLSGAFYDTVSAGSPRLSSWTGLPPGSSIGHAAAHSVVEIDKICGPFKKVEKNKFRVAFDRTYLAKGNRLELVFQATHPGDGTYKPAVQQASMIIPQKITEGANQHIDFPKIPNQKVGVKSLELNASTDSDLQVYYYILEGPAEIRGNRVLFTKIPPRSKFPIKVTLVAWQYGRSSTPKVKSAEPVEQSFLLTKNQ